MRYRYGVPGSPWAAIVQQRFLCRGPVKYLPPFDLIRRSFELSTVKGELRVSASYEDFLNVIRTMIAGIDVDET